MSLLKTIKRHKLILDTHVFLWLVSGEKKFKPVFLKMIQERRLNPNIFISPISIWEIGILDEKKRIILGTDRLEWIESTLEKTGFEIVPVSPAIAIQSTRLPGEIHGDPADRFLIATAHEIKAVLVTCDQKILKYGKDRYIDVFDPCKA